jgi:predicted dehydrogenase
MSIRPDASLRVAIAGAGIRGRLYAKVLRGIAGVEVVGLCDPSPNVAEAAHAELGLPVVTSHHELLGKRPDAFIVATPDFAHVEVAVDAAGAGCHLMVEKPLAMTVEDATTIADVVSRAGRQCLVAFENRWNPAFSGIKERVDSGELGPVVSQSAVLNVSRLVPNQMIGWAARTSPIWFQMSHTLDLAMWLSGQDPVRVSAVGGRGRLGIARLQVHLGAPRALAVATIWIPGTSYRRSSSSPTARRRAWSPTGCCRSRCRRSPTSATTWSAPTGPHSSSSSTRRSASPPTS